MKLLFALLADAAQVSNGKVYVLGGGWNVVTPHAPGTTLQCSLVVGLSLAPLELGQEHTLTAYLLKDGQREGPLLTWKFHVPRQAAMGRRFRVLASLPCEVSCAKAGEFEIEIRVGDSKLGSVDLLIEGVRTSMPVIMPPHIGSS